MLQAGASWSACRELLELGLLLAENRDEPRSEWILRVPSSLWDAARGRLAERPAPGLVHQSSSAFPEVDALILPPELRGQVAHLPLLLNRAEDANDRLSAVIVRGMQGAGRRTVLGAIARALGRDVLLLDATRPSKEEGAAQRGAASDDGANRVRVSEEAWRLLGPLATLMGALPVVRLDPAPGETLELRPLAGYQGPVGITLGRSGGLAGPLVEQALSLTLPPPDRPARAQFWEAALGRQTNGHRSGVVPGVAPGIGVKLPAGLQQPAVPDEIIDSFLLTGGHIHRAARLARAHAALAGRTDLDVDDVRQATRSLNRQVLETLATHLPARGGWHELIVSPATSRELTALETRCRQREQLREQAGPAFDRSLNRGVRALFTGPSGTGKTLAAASLAAALGMDLYRVDLAAVVNKYIGETERNLNQVLSRAEELDVVLLLDEGDALMTRRTDVRNANDRYANLETNYLLQRLEIYEGIAIITTNAGQRIDTAFLRRLDVIVDFTPPDAAERWQIWQAHLPVDHEVSPALLDEIAARCALTGGQIRNAALHATLLAGGSAVAVGDEHVEAALQREYRKAGAAYPMSSHMDGPDGGHMGRLRRFAGVAG